MTDQTIQTSAESRDEMRQELRQLREENSQFRELLEAACSAIEWWCDECQEKASEADLEFLENVKVALKLED